MNFAYSDTQEEIRAAVNALCAKFGSEYWQRCEESSAYPEEFVAAMAAAGWLAALIPEEYGGSGLSIMDACVIQFPIAKAFMNVQAAELMRNKAAALFDAQQPCGREATMTKYLASEASWEAAEAAMTTFGGYGFANEYHVEPKWKEARLFRTAPISNNLVLAQVAQHMLGMPRSY